MSRASLCYRKKTLIRLLTSIASSLNSFFSQGSEEWVARSQHNAQFTEEFQTSPSETFFFVLFFLLEVLWENDDEFSPEWLLRAVWDLSSTTQGQPLADSSYRPARGRGGSRPWHLSPVSRENRPLVHNLLPLQDAKMSHVEIWRVGRCAKPAGTPSLPNHTDDLVGWNIATINISFKQKLISYFPRQWFPGEKKNHLLNPW